MDSRDPWEKNQAVVMSNAAVKRAVLSSVICIMWCKCWRVRNAVHIDKITEWRVGIYLIREQENIWLAWNKITNSSYYCFFLSVSKQFDYQDISLYHWQFLNSAAVVKQGKVAPGGKNFICATLPVFTVWAFFS